jgi:DNA invertase Pin-like site-specific DNA recombinase
VKSGAIRVRVSTTEQANSDLSLDTQRQQVAGYAMMKGWPVDEFFVEAGVSGSVELARRPEGLRLLGTLQPGDIVVTAKLDRAFRSASDALGTLEELKGQGVQLHMIDLGGDVTGNGISKLVFTILSAVAENERDRIRERVRDAKRHRAAQRLYNGGRRPFGYDIVNGGLVPNEREQVLLKAARAMHANGRSLRDITMRLAMMDSDVQMDPKTLQRILARPADGSQSA